MSTDLRTFVGIPVTVTPALTTLLQHLAHCGKGLKVESPDKLHLTLTFLGDTPRDLQPRIETVVRQIADESITFELTLFGLGAFPTIARPSVVWVDVRPVEPLQRLARRLEEELQPLGFAPEKRPYRPHLTVARCSSRPPAELAQIFTESRETLWSQTPCQRLVWYRSELNPQGSKYSELLSCPLSKSP